MVGGGSRGTSHGGRTRSAGAKEVPPGAEEVPGREDGEHWGADYWLRFFLEKMWELPTRCRRFFCQTFYLLSGYS